ncbi:MAG: hypothetical protein NT157_06080 [Candidatus Micrarchaeota archaeon]|nr:hypothetical protein [Candidatus Micrarchaeota archaeon]
MDWAKISDPELEGAFQKTAKIVFGREIGALSSFSGYLTEMMLPFRLEKSFISGKDLMVSLPFYSDNARFLSQDEAGMLKLEPLNVNEIKDIDSLFQAVRERAVYSGNKLFGTNFEVKNVDNSANCAHVSNSHGVYNTKYGAYISCMRESEYVFGASLYPDSKFSIRLCDGVGANRCFETYYGTNLSDTYYVFNCIGCHDCMFSFNLRSKRNVIGNLELPRDRYSTLKQKLVSEIADELARKKRIFSIAEIAFHGRDRKGLPDEETAYDSPVPPRVEQAFRSTTRLILGRERAGIRTFGPWLLRNAIKVKKIKGALGSPTYKIEGLPIVREIPADRLVTLVEGVSLSKSRHINLAEGEEPSLNELLEKVAKIAYFGREILGLWKHCRQIRAHLRRLPPHTRIPVLHELLRPHKCQGMLGSRQLLFRA